MRSFRFQRLLQMDHMAIILEAHRHIFDRLAGIQPDFQLFTRIHHFKFQFRLHVIERAGDTTEVIDRSPGWHRRGRFGLPWPPDAVVASLSPLRA